MAAKKYKLKSSNLKSMTYDSASKDLVVSFKNGTSYRYSKVPAHIARAIRKNKSAGKTFNKRIRMGKYQYEKVAAGYPVEGPKFSDLGPTGQKIMRQYAKKTKGVDLKNLDYLDVIEAQMAHEDRIGSRELPDDFMFKGFKKAFVCGFFSEMEKLARPRWQREWLNLSPQSRKRIVNAAVPTSKKMFSQMGGDSKPVDTIQKLKEYKNRMVYEFPKVKGLNIPSILSPRERPRRDLQIRKGLRGELADVGQEHWTPHGGRRNPDFYRGGGMVYTKVPREKFRGKSAQRKAEQQKQYDELSARFKRIYGPDFEL